MPKHRDDHFESYLGDMAGDPLLPPRCYGEPARTFRMWFVVFILGLLIVLFLAGLAMAQVQIPQACIVLAESLGRTLPPTMGKFKYNQTKAELRFLSNDDPAVKRCREALARMEARK